MKNFLITVFVILSFNLMFGENLSLNSGKVVTDEITFEWKIIGNEMECILRGKTSGWVSVGFNPTDKMKDANYIIGYVNGNDVLIHDHFGHSPIGHRRDIDYRGGEGTEDVTVISGKESGGWTELVFRIPLDSGDKYDVPLLKGTHKIILAHGPRKNFTSKHRFVGYGEITIHDIK